MACFDTEGRKGLLVQINFNLFSPLFVWRLSVDIHNSQLLTCAIHVLARNVFFARKKLFIQVALIFVPSI